LIPTIDIIPPNGSPPIISNITFGGYTIDVLRLDTIHEVINGNKWFKLKNAIAHCVENNLKGIISFGGAYSNHLHALSYACNVFGLESIGIINGTTNNMLHTPTLLDCKHAGMQLHLGGHNAYKNTIPLQHIINVNPNEYYTMPMGGGDILSIEGAGDIYNFIDPSYTDIWLAAGSGTTALGILQKASIHQQVHIISPVKNNIALHNLLKSTTKLNYNTYYYNIASKFGKINAQVIALMQQYKQQYSIELDAIYTVHVLHYLIHNMPANIGARVLLLHTGGLQGNRSIL
jgi:1-aminocyclopropane-1-carboxylate deaminase